MSIVSGVFLILGVAVFSLSCWVSTAGAVLVGETDIGTEECTRGGLFVFVGIFGMSISLIMFFISGASF
jgi:hypothetical protein